LVGGASQEEASDGDVDHRLGDTETHSKSRTSRRQRISLPNVRSTTKKSRHSLSIRRFGGKKLTPTQDSDPTNRQAPTSTATRHSDPPLLEKKSVVERLCRAFLRRAPSSDELEHLMQCDNEDDIRFGIASLPDFYLDPVVRRGFALAQYRRLNSAADPIQIDSSPQELQSLHEVAITAWESLGCSDPFWSVMVSDQFRYDRMAGREEAFYAAGLKQVDFLLHALERHGFCQTEFEALLEVGCGVGRMTEHLARQFQRVLAVDVSQPHIDIARTRMTKLRLDNVEFAHIIEMKDYDRLGAVDLIISINVLQHCPPPVIAKVLGRCFDALNPGGVAYFHVPTFIEGYTFSIDNYLASDRNALDMHCIPQRAIFELLEQHRLSLLEVVNDGSGGDFRYEVNRFFVRKL
jgi:2-polyprenyl-3-methyl-5-hydroxy-6-metoxy-1,4-benzoquinol methylase